MLSAPVLALAIGLYLAFAALYWLLAFVAKRARGDDGLYRAHIFVFVLVSVVLAVIVAMLPR